MINEKFLLRSRCHFELRYCQCRSRSYTASGYTGYTGYTGFTGYTGYTGSLCLASAVTDIGNKVKKMIIEILLTQLSWEGNYIFGDWDWVVWVVDCQPEKGLQTCLG